MKDLQDIIQGRLTPSVYYRPITSDRYTIQRVSETAGLYFYYLEGEMIQNRNDLWDSSIQAFHFPSKTGKNFDAFYDRLQGIPWNSPSESDRGNGVIIFYNNFQVLAEHEPAHFEYMYGCFCEVIDTNWSKYGYREYLILRGDSHTLPYMVRSDLLSYPGSKEWLENNNT